MKELGLITLLSVAVTAAAPGSQAYRPAIYQTPKSTQDFANCFARTQERRSIPWWFVPKDHGGTFSNIGGKAAGKQYFLVINDRGPRREIQLTQVAGEGVQERGVSECI